MRTILFLVPATLEALEQKGVAPMILERDESGYFDHVFTVHFPAPGERTIRLNPRHTVIEVSQGRSPFFKNANPSPFIRLLLLASTLRFLLKMQKLIRLEKIALIRATEPYQRGLYAFLLSKLTGVPWCVSLHADYEKCFELDPERGAPRVFGSRLLAKRLEQFVLAHAPMVLAIRESLEAYAVRNGADPKRIRIIPHGIQMDQFLKPSDPRFKERFTLEGRRVITFVGRLSKENYVFDVLAIAKAVAFLRRDVVFLIVGDGDERGALEAMVDQHGLQGHVRFFGFLPREQVADFRVNADVNLCLMGGFSLIEAAAAGRPLIAYDVEWHRELVKDGETGFLIPEHDVQGAAAAILRLLENPDLADRLGKRARELALERHSLEVVSRIRIRCYEELLSSCHPE
ncbi:MAG: glycosyltransferase [candidate division NC10 bacterium]|nr:glycosyltransferase [candidate division NC10 bacterium]